jgi:hypothetical protein
MKFRSLLIAFALMVSAPASADPLKAAVFDFELVDTSLQGEVDGPRADEQRRLMNAGGHLITPMSADFRGNTDESWSRAASYLLRNRLLAPHYSRPITVRRDRNKAKLSNARRASADDRS